MEFHGGFHALESNPNATFKSSLPLNGTVAWSIYDAELSYESNQYANAALSVSFPHLDWAWLKEVYGWSVFQWQGWARGEIYVRTEDVDVLILHTEYVLEYWIDDVHYFGGDFYGYKKVPVTLRLDPGRHRIDARLIRDVRSMGGIGTNPSLKIKLELQRSRSALRSPQEWDRNVLISDVIGGDFGPIASPYAAIIVRNDAEKDIYVHEIEGMRNTCELELLSKSSIRLVPGQTRQISFRVGCIPSYNRRMYMSLRYRIDGSDADLSFQFSTWPRVLKGMEQPHKVTFMHPGGMVSYAILRPPSSNIQCGQDKNLTLPVLLALHGAGLEADSDIVKHALDDLPDLCAWVLFPTGVTPWSGDDWHNWGLTNVEEAIASIPRWMEQVDWKGPGVDVDKWLVSGHSNGGQGAWYVLTHRPDKVIAAAVLSAYSSIQNYVPYTFWYAAEPFKETVVQSALLPYRHELLMKNAKGIPVFQQHGSEDDNVPVYNARLMSQRIDQAGAESTYFEVPGGGHYWDGIMVTKPLREFFNEHLASNLESNAGTSLNQDDFGVVVADPGDMGPKYGVEVLALSTPGELGKVEVTFDPLTSTCIFSTFNIQMLRVPYVFNDCRWMIVDDEKVALSTEYMQGAVLRRDVERWHAVDYSDVNSLEWRSGRQQGAMDAILRSVGAFSIVKHSQGTEHVALQVSRNLCQYFTADTNITEDYKEALASTGNIVSIAVGLDLPKSLNTNYPIEVSSDGIVVRYNHINTRYYPRHGSDLAAVFLRPLPDERLELVVWALNVASLGTAARLVPMLTGSGQPDFVVADRDMLRKGVEGTLALGFFDSEWNVSSNSFVTRS